MLGIWTKLKYQSNPIHIIDTTTYEVIDIPEDLKDIVDEWRQNLVESVAEYDDNLLEKFFEDPDSITKEEMMSAIRKAFDATGNLVTSVHYFLSLSDSRYEKMLPPLTPLSKEKQKNLLDELKRIGFYPERKAA